MRPIDADELNKRRADYIAGGYAQSFDDMTEWGKAIAEAPTIKTKQVKYYDEDESVWKIGSVIVDE